MTPDPNHPITDLDATFTTTKPEDTYRVMQALRGAGVTFDVTVNGPKDDPTDQDYDILWFRRNEDQDFIGRVVREALAQKE